MPSTREKLHASLRKLRDVYRAGVKRGRYKAEIAEYNARLGLRADVRDFEKARKQTDCDVEEYFGFEFYKKDEAERDAYLTRVRRTKLIRKMGDVDEGLTIPGNKVLFNTLFGEYLRRAWISPTAATANRITRTALRKRFRRTRNCWKSSSRSKKRPARHGANSLIKKAPMLKNSRKSDIP